MLRIGPGVVVVEKAEVGALRNFRPAVVCIALPVALAGGPQLDEAAAGGKFLPDRSIGGGMPGIRSVMHYDDFD